MPQNGRPNGRPNDRPNGRPAGILLTRPTQDAPETAARVRAMGFHPILAPVLTLEPRPVRVDGPFDAVLATSRNAIPALPAHLRPLKLLAVGGATARRARDAGFATVLDADGDAAALAALAAASLAPGARLLFAHGARQGDTLAGALLRAGFRVTRCEAYAVTEAAHWPGAATVALEAGDVRAAMFLSAETAYAFARLLPAGLGPRLADVHAVAIGPAAAARLAPLPWREVRVSLKPTLDEVLALL